jgi:hypothetical protein
VLVSLVVDSPLDIPAADLSAAAWAAITREDTETRTSATAEGATFTVLA